MRTLSSYLVALGLAAAGLSSCGRSSYSYQSKAPAYLGTVPTAVAAKPAPSATLTAVTTPDVQSAVVSTARETTPVISPAVQPIARVQPVEELALAQTAVAAAPAPAKAHKLPVAQRLMLSSVLKQATRATARQQNTASVTDTAALGKPSLTVTIVGLIALIVGLIVDSGFLVTVGIIVAVVGIVLLLLKKL